MRGPPRGARAGQGGGPGWALPGSRGADGGLPPLSFAPRPLQAGPLVANQRGSELRLHHPASEGPPARGRQLLTFSPPLFKSFPGHVLPFLY